MPKRGENIHKRADGRWEGRYKIGRDELGRIKYGSVYGKTYGEVKLKLAETSHNAAATALPKRGDRSFEEILLLWMETNQVKFKGATENKYKYLIERHIVPELGTIKVSELTISTINAFMTKKLRYGRLDQKGGLSSAYVRNMMLIVEAAMQYAVNERMCHRLQTAIYVPSPDKKDLPILNVKDQKRLEEMLLHDLNLTGLGVLISLHTGLRIGEVCALTWNDIDLSENIIHVRSTVTRVRKQSEPATTSQGTVLILDKPKTKASIRDIPISSVLLPHLQKIKREARFDFVVSERPAFISPRTYEYRFHRLLNSCGIGRINYHALRHTFATRCIEAGVDVKSLSEILGHANVSVTLNTYVHSSMDLKRRQIEKLALLLS